MIVLPPAVYERFRKEGWDMTRFIKSVMLPKICDKRCDKAVGMWERDKSRPPLCR